MNSPIPFIKKHKTLAVICGVGVIVFGWWAIVNFMPHPLGDKMEYLGKEDYGCWVGLCDSRPASIYYYGTDLDSSGVVSYFAKSRVVEEPSLWQGKNDFGIQAPSGETIYISLPE